MGSLNIQGNTPASVDMPTRSNVAAAAVKLFVPAYSGREHQNGSEVQRQLHPRKVRQIFEGQTVGSEK